MLEEKFEKNQKILKEAKEAKIKIEKIDIESLKKEMSENKLSSDHIEALKLLSQKKS